MRAAMSPSSARAVARKATRPADWAASSTAWRLLPLRAPPSTRCEECTAVTSVLPRGPAWVAAAGQVSWLSERPTPRAFPIRLGPDQWPIAGFVPDHSDGVAADSHRLPWGPHPAGRPDTVDGQTVAEGPRQRNPPRRAGYKPARRSMRRRSRLGGRPAPGGR